MCKKFVRKLHQTIKHERLTMKKNLLLSTALIGSVAISGAAVAETKIKGSVQYTYSNESGTDAAASKQGAGIEKQIDISNSGELDNGMSYKAGFSMEADGNQAMDNGEGNFISFSSGNTTVMWNNDKAKNLSDSATPRVGQMAQTMAAGLGTTAAYDHSAGTMAKDQWNLALTQKLDGIGRVDVVYAPRAGDDGGANDNPADTTQGNSVLDIIYKGNFGVDGLTVFAGISDHEKENTTQTQAFKATKYGVGYSFGQFSVGYTETDMDETDGTEDEQSEYGVTFAVNDQLSLGILRADTKLAGTSGEEVITGLQAGYSLGPVGVEVYHVTIEEAGSVSTVKDQEKLGLRLTTKF